MKLNSIVEDLFRFSLQCTVSFAVALALALPVMLMIKCVRLCVYYVRS